jgi:hypothetical protein
MKARGSLPKAPSPRPLVFGAKIVGGGRVTVPVGDMADSTYLPSGNPISVNKFITSLGSFTRSFGEPEPHLRELVDITFRYCQACYCDEN